MSARTTVPTGAGSATAGCVGRRAASVVGVDSSQFALDLLTAALFAFDRRILLTHGADGFKFFLARLTNIFVNGHIDTCLILNFDAIVHQHPIPKLRKAGFGDWDQVHLSSYRCAPLGSYPDPLDRCASRVFDYLYVILCLGG
jgi:hypothetical protein